MKKLRYSTGLKITAVVVQQILFVVLVISILLVTTLFQKNILNFGDVKNKSFQDSAYFVSLFEKSTEDILNFVDYRRKFETAGSYDSEKLIDIRKYYRSQGKQGEVLLDKNTEGNLSGYYNLGDLVEWGRDYTTANYQFSSSCYIDSVIHQKQTITKGGSQLFDQEKSIESLSDMSIELQENIISSVEHYYGGSYEVFSKEQTEIAEEEQDRSGSNNATEAGAVEETEQLNDIIKRVIDGELYKLDGHELGLLLRDMGMETLDHTSNYDFVEEEYFPVGGKGIWSNFIQENFSEAEMQNEYEALEYTLENIGQEVNTYKKCLNQYNLGEEGSNVYYWIKKGNEDKIYTNIAMEEEGIQDLTEYGKKMGKYFFYRETDMRLESNVKGMEDIFYNQIEQTSGGKDNILFVCVNTSFPHADSFYEAKQEYSTLYPWIYISIASMVISALGCLICFIYLSTVAGKTGEKEEAVLCWFDRIPTELAFIGATMSGIATVVMYGQVMYRFGGEELAGHMIIAGVVAFLTTAFLMIFYLSFVRRIRAGVLWKESITHWIISGIGGIFQAGRPLAKMIIWFGIHLLASMIIIPMLINADEVWQMWGIGVFVGMSLVEGVLIIREGAQRNKVLEGIGSISSGDLEFKIDAEELKGDNKNLAKAVNAVGDGLFHAVDASMKNERLKADLITNVSHDIKTPLTSIINYVDLLKREDIPNQRIETYLTVLEQKSQRLKQLTEDLVEASKISSGNLVLQMERINFVELVYQTGGEFNEKFEAKGLTAVTKLPKEPVVIMADGRRIWRVIENLYNNVAKYAMANTRVYVDMEIEEEKAILSIKNISENALNIAADELTERFIRGDVSRSTEGSGLGLSIAKNLTNLMGGDFEIYLDGDLFKVTISFKRESKIPEIPAQD